MPVTILPVLDLSYTLPNCLLELLAVFMGLYIQLLLQFLVLLLGVLDVGLLEVLVGFQSDPELLLDHLGTLLVPDLQFLLLQL